LRTGDLQRYLDSWRPGLTKRNLILDMEVPLTHTFVRWGYSVSAIGTALELDSQGQNPSIFRWDRLFDCGIPFVKREIFINQEFRDRLQVDAVLATVQAFSDFDVPMLVAESVRQIFPGDDHA
jgi:hypothetical protein